MVSLQRAGTIAKGYAGIAMDSASMALAARTAQRYTSNQAHFKYRLTHFLHVTLSNFLAYGTYEAT